jgi:hypothetical protein
MRGIPLPFSPGPNECTSTRSKFEFPDVTAVMLEVTSTGRNTFDSSDFRAGLLRTGLLYPAEVVAGNCSRLYSTQLRKRLNLVKPLEQ